MYIEGLLIIVGLMFALLAGFTIGAFVATWRQKQIEQLWHEATLLQINRWLRRVEDANKAGDNTRLAELGNRTFKDHPWLPEPTRASLGAARRICREATSRA